MLGVGWIGMGLSSPLIVSGPSNRSAASYLCAAAARRARRRIAWPVVAAGVSRTAESRDGGVSAGRRTLFGLTPMG